MLNTWGNGIKILSISVTLPSGLSWDDYYVTCYLANDITGYNYNNSTSLLESEPSIFALKYTFDLARLISTDFQHNYSPGGDLYSRDQVVEANGHRYQKTRTWTYQLYANPGETINLVLPLENMYNNSGGVSTGSGNNLEPHAYYRWYNYQTDAIDINSTPFINDGTKKLLSYPWGYMAYDYGTSNFVYSDVGVLNYTVPAEFLDDGVVIACDVSDYKDYGLTRDGVFFKEPTLSLRYIFQIKPASVMADEIKQVTKPDQFLFLENYGYMTLNCATDALNDNTEFTLRVEQRLPQDYFFYRATQVNYLSAIYSWDQAPLTKATAIYWCAVDKKGSLIKKNSFSKEVRKKRC